MRVLCKLLWVVLVAVPGAHAAPPTRPPPAPWSGIEVAGRTVRMTDKAVTLSAEGLPEQIVIRGEALLSGPVQLSLDGSPLRSRAASAAFAPTLSAGRDRLEYTLPLQVDIAGSSVTFSLSGAIEYDGLIALTLSTPRLPAALLGKSIVYRVPLREDVARFLHRGGEVGRRNVELGSIGSGGVASAWSPFLWLGNDSRGVFWVAETSAGWGNAAKPDALRVSRTGQGWVLEVTVKPVPLNDGGWQHRFALLPTPVKTLPDQWRRQRLWPARSHTAYVIWPNEADAAIAHFGYPQSTDPARLSAYLQRMGSVAGVPYTTPTWISTNAPEWQQYREEWSGGVADKAFEGSEKGDFHNVCPARASWQTFARTRFASFISTHRLRGLYMDNSQLYAIHNCVLDDEDPRALDYPALPQREIYRGIVEGLRRNSARTLAIVHSSGGVNAPSFSSVDAWVNGEQYRGKVTDDYLDVATLTDFRVELNGAQWGFIPYFLPEFPAEQAKRVAPTRKLMSILLLHDAIPWPLWANLDEVNRGLAMLDDFGVADAEFVAYYSAAPLATSSAPETHVSGYRARGRSLLIVANLGARPRTSDLCLTSPTGSAGSDVVSWPGRERLQMRDGCARIDVDAGSYAMYVVAR